MKILRFALTNTTSYRQRVEFVFDKRLNILIGPNGGGKSNLQRALALVLTKYFLHQYDFTRDDDQARVAPVDLWTKRVLQRTLAPFIGETGDQVIEIVLAPEASDLANVMAIGANLDRFNEELSYWESPMPTYSPLEYAEAIGASKDFSYRVTNFDLEEPTAGTASWAFREYLRTFFIFMRLAGRLPDVKLTSPVFFFFSERTSKGRMEIQSNQITEQNYFSGFRSAYQAATGDNTNLLQWGAQHFARLYWKAVTRAAQSRDVVAQEVFAQEPDVKLLNHYMEQLGYEWDFLTDVDSVSYAFALRKKGTDPWLTPDIFSSGEKEIVHFLLAMFALNVKDGVVIVDEPELHLHPRWQRIFLGLFTDIAPARNNQFVIATHSPVFVTPDSINSITRVYRTASGNSTRIALREVELPEKKNLVRMINSQNNERVFFADKAILVEGMSDRLVFASLLEAACSRFGNNEAIEIMEVGGKSGFGEYRALLDALDTPSYIIADLDYLREVGEPTTKALFKPNEQKAWEALKEKKGLDGRTALGFLSAAVKTANLEELAAFLEYLEARHERFQDHFDEGAMATVRTNIEELRGKRIYVLERGEIEDYLPPGGTDIRSIVELTTDRSWINKVPDADRRVAMGRIVCDVLGVGAGREAFLEELKAGAVTFPRPLA